MTAEQLQDIITTQTSALLALGQESETVHNAVVVVDHPGLGLHASAAAGQRRADGAAAMSVDSQFHIASIVKPMTAVLIYQAMEEGRLGSLGTDTRLIDTGVLPPDICRRLHNIDGRCFAEAITLRHLLTHTSGLRDGQIDDGDFTSFELNRSAPNSISGRRAVDLPRHMECIAAGTTPPDTLRTRKHWLPWDPARPDDPEAGVINFYISAHTAGENALFPPGEGFHYSDTAFTILALLAEQLLGASFHRLLRSRIFDPLGMNDSYFEAHSDLDPAPWMRELSDCWNGPIPLVSAGIDLSNDWGGGGVIGTAADLNRFMMGLMAGKLFREAGTLDAMLHFTQPIGLARYAAVGHGVLAFDSPGGRRLFGHSGAWGAKMLFDPANGFYFSGTVNRRGAKAEWMLEIADRVAEALG